MAIKYGYIVSLGVANASGYTTSNYKFYDENFSRNIIAFSYDDQADSKRVIGVLRGAGGKSWIELLGNQTEIKIDGSWTDGLGYAGVSRYSDLDPNIPTNPSASSRYPYLNVERNGVDYSDSEPQKSPAQMYTSDGNTRVPLQTYTLTKDGVNPTTGKTTGTTPTTYGTCFSDGSVDSFLSSPFNQDTTSATSVDSNVTANVKSNIALVNAMIESTSNVAIEANPMGKLYGIPVTADYDGAIAYLDGGNLPADAETEQPPKKKPAPEPDPKPRDDTDRDGNDDYQPNDTNGTSPRVLDGGVNYYLMTGSDIEGFFAWMNGLADDPSTIIQDWFTGLYSNISNCIVGIKRFVGDETIVANGLSSEFIKLGFLTADYGGSRIVTTPSKDHFFGSVDIAEKFHTFYDYNGYTSASMYLPYIGWFDLDIEVWTGHTINVYYITDIPSGNITYFLKLELDGSSIVIDSKTGRFMHDIPYSLENGIAYTESVINKAVGGVSSMVNGDVMGTLGAVMQPPSYMGLVSGQSSDDMTMEVSPMHGYVIIKRPIYKNPAGYGSHVGYPLYEGRTLNDLNGFTQVQSARINEWTSEYKPTREEIEEIYALLEKGVIL